MKTLTLEQTKPLLASDEVTRFNHDGFIGPFDGSIPSSTIDQVADRLEHMAVSTTPHPLYGRFSVRDWHLVDNDVLSLFTDPQIVSRIKPLLGENLILWRTKVFRKRPLEGPLGWHQEWGAFNGEEIGNDVPGLQPAPHSRDLPWNLTVWVALENVTDAMGPIYFARGTHRRRFPIQMAPLDQSEFWHDPFLDITDPKLLVQKAKECSLVLDVDTSKVFDEVNIETLTMEAAKTRLLSALSERMGAVTLEFDPGREDIVKVPMNKGQFVIFTERTMHGSPANISSKRRLAINGRITRADTIVYPGRLRGNFIDGSNLDIRKHRCVLLSGEDRQKINLYG